MMIFGSRFQFKHDVFDGDYGDSASSAPSSPAPSLGLFHRPSDALLVQGLSTCHLVARKAYQRVIGPCLILAISFITAALVVGSGAPVIMGNLLAWVLWLSACGALLLAMLALHRGHLHHLCQATVGNFYRNPQKMKLPDTGHYRLLYNLGLSSAHHRGEIITTALYLVHDKRDLLLRILAISSSFDDRRYFDQSMPLADFVGSAFGRKKAVWNFSDAQFEASYRGFCPNVNRFVKVSLVEYFPEEAYPSIRAELNKDGPLLNALLLMKPDDLDILPDVGETQLRAWCRQNLPKQRWFHVLSPKRTSAQRLVRAIEGSVIIAKPVPAALLAAAAEYCLTPAGACHMRSFVSWLWHVSPAPMPKPKDPHIENTWMLKAVSRENLFHTRYRVYAKFPMYFEVYKDTIRKILDAVGIDPNAPMDDECYVGYRNLYGLEATLSKYPGSSRILLHSDLNV